MKKYISCLLFSALLVTQTSWSQSYTFSVMGTKGSPEKKVNNAWSLVKIGDRLNASDEVKVPANGYLGLAHATGKPLEVREPGTYSVAALAAKMNQGNSPLSKYKDFILSSEEDKKNKLSATGAVHRGGASKIQLDLPPTGKADLLNNYFILTWVSDGSSAYTVTIGDMLDNTLATYQTKTNSVEINMPELKTNSVAILVTVKSDKGNTSEKFVVRSLTGDRRKAYADIENDIAELAREKTALNKFMLGNAYESRLLLIDALTAYKEAADLEPEVYSSYYQSFLERMGYR